MNRYGMSLTAAVVMAAFVGCSNSDGMVPVEGQVMLNGKPLETGQMQFIPTQGTKGPTSGAALVDGKFSARIPEGKILVKITSPEKYGPRTEHFDPATNSTVVNQMARERVPAKYNEISELVVDVKSGGEPLVMDLKP